MGNFFRQENIANAPHLLANKFMSDDPSVYADDINTQDPSPGHLQYDRSPWHRLLGASIVKEACGPSNSDDMMLLFSEEGPRMAVLKEVDTRNIR